MLLHRRFALLFSLPLLVLAGCAAARPVAETNRVVRGPAPVPPQAASPAPSIALDASPGVWRAHSPRVRAVRWTCDEQECEGWPVYAYEYLPAVSDDGELVAIVEERDGWRHTAQPGVRIVSVRTHATVQFFPLTIGARDMTTMPTVERRKGEFEALVAAANDGLSKTPFRALYPASNELARGDTRDWDPESGCSTRAFQLVGVRPELRLAVFVATISSTSHNCDGVPEKQPWPVRVVRW